MNCSRNAGGSAPHTEPAELADCGGGFFFFHVFVFTAESRDMEKRWMTAKGF